MELDPMDFNPEVLQKDLAINDADLDSAMMTQAGLFARYAQVAAQLQGRADKAKMIMEIKESKMDKLIRDRVAAAGEKITEAALAKAILREPEYIKAIAEYNDARMVADLAKNALEAFKQRRDMLVQIGVQRREEMKGELFVRSREAAAANQQDSRAAALAVLGKSNPA